MIDQKLKTYLQPLDDASQTRITHDESGFFKIVCTAAGKQVVMLHGWDLATDQPSPSCVLTLPLSDNIGRETYFTEFTEIDGSDLSFAFSQIIPIANMFLIDNFEVSGRRNQYMKFNDLTLKYSELVSANDLIFVM